MPCVRSASAPYLYIQNEGRRYDLLTQAFADKCYAQQQANEDARKAIAAATYSSFDNEDKEVYRKDAALRKAEEIINGAVKGTRNSTMWRVLCWLKNACGMDAVECSNIDVPSDMLHEYQSMLSRIW